MNSSKTQQTMVTTIAALALLCSCGQKKEGESSSSSKSPDNKSATSTDTASKTDGSSTASGTGTDTGTASSTDTGTASSTATDTTTNTIASNPATTGTTTGAPPATTGAADQAAVPNKVDLNKLPNDVAICSVAGNEIKVADYKRMLRISQIQMNQKIVTDPITKAGLVQQAQRLGIELSPDEKSRLLDAAHKEKGADPKQFQAFLKSANATEKQFDDEVLQSGLAFKASNAILERTLLGDLVNRELLAQAAKESGGEKEAMNQYFAFKQSKNYDAILQQTSLAPDALRDEMVKANLAKFQLSKLESQVKVSDAELKKIYEANKKQLKHGERVRLSTILILCPEKDIGPVGSVRTQIMRSNPKLTGTELDTAVAQYMEQAKQKALILLGQAKSNDFAKLANENSMDPDTMAKKNGGDMGFLERAQIIKPLGDEVWKLKAGEVMPQVVKSDLGYNIYKLTAKEGPGELKFDEVKGLLSMQAKQAKLQQTLAQWLDGRRKNAKIAFSPKFVSIANSPK